MADLNITVMSGRLVRDPVVRNNGSKMAFFTIASNRRYRDKSDAWQEETAFVPCKSFGWWAEAAARHAKGDTLIVEGRWRTETWSDDGTTRSQLVLVVDSVQFFTPEPRAQSSSPSVNGTENNRATLPPGGPSRDAPPF
jgi:single stranded DNA-binding protein